MSFANILLDGSGHVKIGDSAFDEVPAWEPAPVWDFSGDRPVATEVQKVTSGGTPLWQCDVNIFNQYGKPTVLRLWMASPTKPTVDVVADTFGGGRIEI